MRRLLWMSLGSLLTLLASAIGWFVSGGWHTNEIILASYLKGDKIVAIYSSTGRAILPPTKENDIVVTFDMMPQEDGYVISVEGMPNQIGDYVFPCDGERHIIVVRKDGSANSFGIKEGNFLYDLRRATRCLTR